MTDFRRWEQFDADGESAKVDAAAARDEDKEKKQELAGAREAFEQAGIEVAADLAETAVAHARVAALGSSRGRGRRQGRRSAAATPSPPVSACAAVAMYCTTLGHGALRSSHRCVDKKYNLDISPRPSSSS